MKKAILIAAAILTAGPVFASKARLSALGNSVHLSDSQNADFQAAFDRPQNFNDVGELATLEWGSSGATSTAPHAEGGFLRKHDDSVYGLYLGRQSDDFNATINAANLALGGTNLLKEENAWNLIYGMKVGDLKYGFSFKYSNATKKQAVGAILGQKSDSMGVTAGVEGANWDVALALGLSGNSSFDNAAGTTKSKSKSNMRVQGGYNMDSMYYYGSYKMRTGELTNPTSTLADVEITDYTLGVVNSTKKDGVDFFYGISYVQNITKHKVSPGTKTEANTLPVIIGIEAEAASWLVLRGSVTQDTNLIGGSKNNNGDVNSTSDNTTVAAGAGLKFNKFLVDGTFATTNGRLADAQGTNGYLAQTAMTYTF